MLYVFVFFFFFFFFEFDVIFSDFLYNICVIITYIGIKCSVILFSLKGFK